MYVLQKHEIQIRIDSRRVVRAVIPVLLAVLAREALQAAEHTKNTHSLRAAMASLTVIVAVTMTVTVTLFVAGLRRGGEAQVREEALCQVILPRGGQAVGVADGRRGG